MAVYLYIFLAHVFFLFLNPAAVGQHLSVREASAINSAFSVNVEPTGRLNLRRLLSERTDGIEKRRSVNQISVFWGRIIET